MLLLGAENSGLNHHQCLDLLESAEDTFDFLTATLTYLIHAEGQKNRPNKALITEWASLKQDVCDMEHSLPGSDVTTYQRAVEVYGQHLRELNLLVDQYMGN